MNMPLTFIFWNDFSYWKPWIAFLIWSTFAFLKCFTSRSSEGRKTTLRLNLENTIWWWQFWCKEDWAADTTTKWGWEAKIKFMQGNFSPTIRVGSWIRRFCYPHSICLNISFWQGSLIWKLSTFNHSIVN